MTSNAEYLCDTLARRLAHGTAGKADLPLLWQLLLCQRRLWLIKGIVVGAAAIGILQLVASALLH